MNKIVRLVFVIAIHATMITQAAAITVDPAARRQTIEGWGTSLSWWADLVGSWPDSQIAGICHAIADTNELNLNLYQYNIGGGENPAHSHVVANRALPGYKASAAAPFDWSADTNQRKVLLSLNKFRGSDAINTAISYSPPYWMTKSQCSSGNFGGADNLLDTCYPAFADYCTEVIKHFHDSLGIVFRALDPMNEPFTTGWVAGGKQEGCAYGQLNQNKLIRSVYSSLSAKSMLSYCSLAVMDGTNLTQTLNNLSGYISAADIIPKIAQINTHSYAGTNVQKARLHTLADSLNKRLWQTESGPLGSSLTDMDIYLLVARRIVDDLNYLGCTAWFDWQACGGGAAWALITCNSVARTWAKVKTFYLRRQFTKYIKRGYTIIGNTDSLTLTALNPAGSELVVVTVNPDSAAVRSCSFDLSRIGKVVAPAVLVRTSSSDDCAVSALSIANNAFPYDAPARSVSTFVIPVTPGPVAVVRRPARGTSGALSRGGKTRVRIVDLRGALAVGKSFETTEGLLPRSKRFAAGGCIVSAVSTDGTTLKSGLHIRLTPTRRP